MLVNRLNFKNLANQVREWRNTNKEQDLFLYLQERNWEFSSKDFENFMRLAHDWLWDGGDMPIHDFICEHWFDKKDASSEG